MRLLLVIALLSLSTLSYAQRKPIPDLPLISFEDAGFNRDSLDILVDRIDNTEHGDFRGLVVIKDHQIAIEWYFNTFWRTHIHDIRSAGKSLTALLLGAAIQDGLVENLDQNVYSLFPKEKYPNMHEDLKKVKLIHLLNMTSGLDADTDDNSTPGNAAQWIGKDEWLSYLLTIPLAAKPGTRWVYTDMNPALVGAIIEEKSGMSLKEYADTKIFKPLGITEWYWYANAANQTGAAGNIYLSTLDFAKLGVLVANEGKWQNQQIIGADYIEQLVTTKEEGVTDWWRMADRYGFFWYKSTRTIGGKTYEYLFASGNGGNHLVVIPEHEMVIALTSAAYGQRHGQGRTYDFMKSVLKAYNK